MKIATLLNTHFGENLVLDTLDSIEHYCTDDIMVIIDGKNYNSLNESFKSKYDCIEGFYHGKNRNPYRNIAYGLKLISNKYPNHDWYCYTEYDTLFGSSDFKINLKEASKRGVDCLGNDFRVNKDNKLMFLNRLFKTDYNKSYYLLGCCLFFSNKFIRTLNKINFFDKFLTYSNDFKKGVFESFEDYDLSEHLYPTLAKHFGGNVESFAFYDESTKSWGGNFEKFLMRFKPEIEDDEFWEKASILHPLKKENSYIRKYFKNKRIREKL